MKCRELIVLCLVVLYVKSSLAGSITDKSIAGGSPKISVNYPDYAIEHCIEGNVTVSYSIGVDGRTYDARVTQSSHPVLDPAALEAVKKMIYRTKGKEFPVHNVSFKFTFLLNEKKHTHCFK